MTDSTEVTLWDAESEADLDTVARLARRVWEQHYPGIISRAQIDYMLTRSYAVPTMRRELADGMRYTLAEIGSESIGFAAYGADDDGESAFLDKMYVAAEWRRHGIARRLLRAVEAHAQALGLRRIRLRVNRRNREAIVAYKRLGFAIEGDHVKEIGGGFVMDDYLMRRPVAAAQAAASSGR